MQTSLGKNSGWIIDSVIDHNINISSCNHLAGSSCIKLTKELDHPQKGLTNIQNFNDNQCFKWFLIRYLNPADHHSVRVRKVGRIFESKLDFKDIKFPVKIIDIHKIEKKELYQY